MARYFGTYGIRGRLDAITPEFTARMCAAFGTGVKRIAIGRDARTSGQMLSDAAIAGFLSAGCDATDLGIVPSPLVEHYVASNGMDGGLIITASHNPPDWNALKFVGKHGIGVSREEGERVESVFERGAQAKASWDAIGNAGTDSLAIAAYSSSIIGLADAAAIKRKRPKVIIDCGNGAAALVAPQLFKALGCRITTLNAQPDGFFPGRSSEPTKENLSDLIAAVKACGAELGVAFDGDADRVIFIDEQGEYVIGDRSFALAAGIALRRKRGAVVTTVATTNAIADIAKKYGSGVEYTKVGGPYISKRMREVSAVIGGEEAGGIVWPELHLGKDGIMSAVRIVEHACKTGKQLSELLASVPIYYNSKTKMECGENEKAKIIAGVGRIARGKITRIDGVRIDFEDSWVIVRASGTEGYVRIFAEAKTQNRADALVREYAAIAGEIKNAGH